MKTIFIFNDSRPTDHLQSIMALGEDGQRIDCIRFDNLTLPHSRFAMGAEHVLTEDDVAIAAPVRMTRASMMRRYDALYGVGNWLPMWLDAPQSNASFRRALHIMRERHAYATQLAPTFSDVALSGILRAIFDSPAAAPHTTH
jgi:hypothetical protein